MDVFCPLVFAVESSLDKLDVAYSIIVNGFGESENQSGFIFKVGEIPDIGEKASYSTIKGMLLGFVLDSADLAFVRCHSVVHIRMDGTANIDDIAAYAKRLDKRLIELVCR